MIREIEREDIPECVRVIRDSFATVADELGFCEENAPRFTAFAMSADRLEYQLYNEQSLHQCHHRHCGGKPGAAEVVRGERICPHRHEEV